MRLNDCCWPRCDFHIFYSPMIALLIPVVEFGMCKVPQNGTLRLKHLANSLPQSRPPESNQPRLERRSTMAEKSTVRLSALTAVFVAPPPLPGIERDRRHRQMDMRMEIQTAFVCVQHPSPTSTMKQSPLRGKEVASTQQTCSFMPIECNHELAISSPS